MYGYRRDHKYQRQKRDENRVRESSPGHGFAVDEAGVRPLHDLKTQVCSVHADKDRHTEREREDEGRVRDAGAKERSRLLKRL